jgi:hypothetical protein
MHIILADHAAQQLRSWFEKLTVCVDHAQHGVDCLERDQSGVTSMIALQVMSAMAESIVESRADINRQIQQVEHTYNIRNQALTERCVAAKQTKRNSKQIIHHSNSSAVLSSTA